MSGVERGEHPLSYGTGYVVSFHWNCWRRQAFRIMTFDFLVTQYINAFRLRTNKTLDFGQVRMIVAAQISYPTLTNGVLRVLPPDAKIVG
jgi:hypothetical protein